MLKLNEDNQNIYIITCACCGKKFESLDVKVDLCKDCMEELADDLAWEESDT